MTHRQEMSRDTPGVGVGVSDFDTDADAGSLSVRPITDQVVGSGELVDINDLDDDFGRCDNR